ncbi:cysteine--tRNA ligase [Candidatus Gottesmanbacteria bacterium RBG_16_52_11]|uniref:Cysteine--tRNA ligase n=1 Tax=Candidatus Gottesmanbacteria bacterium RBG_16_52_11 TaxID=1798374 RepID=A0A1F5YP89_9BACT|nr:MAG: cysteine--tRNA ligase [Candidatus Gottesmanbacteria bacterium RBG_16_52_11]
MKLYNTLTRKIETFEPANMGEVSFYHCGPTVYWTQHIGNLRGMTMGDLLVRTLRYLGYTVTHVRNYTDVGHLSSDADTGEDKMERGAKREGLKPQEIADKYIRIFESDAAEINLLEPTHKSRATQYIGEMIDLVSELLAKGNAYETDLAVYFDISTFPGYTALSGQNLDDLVKGAGRAEVEDPAKRSPLDFAMWFFRTGIHVGALQYWPSPFRSRLAPDGSGFPGWHIECSAMSRKLLGATIDIHMGGVEHIPIHHTNEIAQSEAASGKKFVRYWLHNEHLVVDQGKMAKSAGTGMTLTEVKSRGFDPLALRYFFLSAGYRTRQNFTWDALTDAARGLIELRIQAARARGLGLERTALSEDKLAKVDRYRQQFTDALESDLNIPAGLATCWEVLKSNIPPGDKYDLLIEFDRVLGLNLAESAETSDKLISPPDLPADAQALFFRRQELRRQGNFTEADKLRGELGKMGFTVRDTPDGDSTIRKS